MVHARGEVASILNTGMFGLQQCLNRQPDKKQLVLQSNYWKVIPQFAPLNDFHADTYILYRCSTNRAPQHFLLNGSCMENIGVTSVYNGHALGKL